jgi:hypothetical protein
MTESSRSFARRAAAALLIVLGASALGGCAVIAVAGVAATAAGVVVDTAVGAVKLTGKAVGAAVDIVIPDGEEKK